MAEVKLPLYAVQYEAFDRKKTQEDDEYSSKINNLSVTIVAPSEDAALKDVKNLVVREHYILQEITELTELNTARTTRW